MRIDINVANGVHGRSAEGVLVHVEEQTQDGPESRASGRTDENGLFMYSGKNSNPVGHSRTFQVEIDFDSYFAALAMTSTSRKVAISLRLSDQEECKVRVLITPFMHFMWYAP